MIDQWFVCVMFAFKPCAKKNLAQFTQHCVYCDRPKEGTGSSHSVAHHVHMDALACVTQTCVGKTTLLRNRKHVHHSNAMNIFALHVSKERLAATDTFSESEPSLAPCCIPSIAEYFFALVFFLCCHGLGYHRFLAMYWT